MSQVLSESVATVQACQCGEQPATPAPQRQRIAMVHPTWGVVATGDEFDLDDFDRIASECKPALVTVKAEDPTPERPPAHRLRVDPHHPRYTGVLMIDVDGWEPGASGSLPPLTIGNLSFRLANGIAARWNRQALCNGVVDRNWHLLVCRGKRGHWGVLTVDVPRTFQPESISDLPPAVMRVGHERLQGCTCQRFRRIVNKTRFRRPEPITDWAVVVHAPMI